ncbi:MAG: DNA-binding response regulator [Chloroflexi bacterium]|nr:MAG: DNA-binding response regulator [Chloroflexota bacterium]
MADLRVLLVDDHEVVRMGLRLVLDETPGVRLIAEAANADEALVCCQQLQPDVVIMDIRLPGRSGIQACREITRRWPVIRVVMLSSFIDDDLLAEAIEAGASGYVTKNVGTGELVRALEAVRQGGASFDPAITQRVLEMMRRRSHQGNPFAELTKREIVVLHLLSLGKSNAEIARELTLSDKTVRNHISTILSKLAVDNRVAAATFALSKRVVDYLPQDEMET